VRSVAVQLQRFSDGSPHSYLQKAFGCVCVIQLTDDEKFFFKPALTIEQVRGFARTNARDIIACGFDLKKTLIFNNLDYVG
jgi:tryptophanyl-tRNA synthetase